MDNPTFTRIDGVNSTLSAEQQQQAAADQQFWQLMYTLFYVSFSGFIMSMVYFCFNYVYVSIRRKMTCSITVSGTDDVYKMLIDFLSSKGYLSSSMTQMKCQLKKKSFTWWWQRSKEENQKPEVEYLPGPGNHFFVYKGKKMWAVEFQLGWKGLPKCARPQLSITLIHLVKVKQLPRLYHQSLSTKLNHQDNNLILYFSHTFRVMKLPQDNYRTLLRQQQ